MELKQYQKNVITDLERFLALLTEKQDIAKAYNTLWIEKNVLVGLNGMPGYKPLFPGVPSVCFKVPTGGGKTFLACNAIKPIFDSMPNHRFKAVVWLVPSESILSQTYQALSSADHPYRQKLDVAFGSRVEVYSKEQLLTGQNFNSTSVTEQFSVFVLSYDSFRTSKKEGLKAYKENGYLGNFAKHTAASPEKLLPDVDETALIQVVRSLNPVVIVDESHHATSSLSIEMLENFNPCFVLDLTATPKKGSNIISFVDAVQLKKENMVKLPVIVYNRKSQTDVFTDAITIRAKLEAQANKELTTTGRYIRPIVLFQAQPRTGEESTTFEKIKKTLLDGGIPEAQIAIKTGDKNELKNVDLMSADCPIRYIITVNALKEGWDCPFAYVLATVANRTSAVDVEQILGRVLRLPYTKKSQSNVLNISYVITSSNDFHQTLDKVVVGLNNAGFSSKDYRAKDIESEPTPIVDMPVGQQIMLSDTDEADDNLLEVNIEELRAKLAAGNDDNAVVEDIASDDLFAAALAQNEEYEAEFNNAEATAINLAPQEVRDKMNAFRMNEVFREEASALRIPQFVLDVGPSLFSSGTELLEPENLSKGFTLKDKDVQIDFSTVAAEMARIDIDDAKDATPKAWKLTGFDSTYFKEWFNSRPADHRIQMCKDLIRKQLSKIDCVNDKELAEYIDRAVGTLTEDQLSDLEQSPYPYIIKIKDKVQSLLDIHRASVFDLWLEQGKILCEPQYALPSMISPTSVTSIIPKSLYTSEEEMNEFEYKVVWDLSALDNIKWWHRNISRLGFNINGSTNAYPDLIVMTNSGKILMVETKGDHLDNDISERKARLGDRWASQSGKQYRYFMVFQTKQPTYSGAYSRDRFMEIVKGL